MLNGFSYPLHSLTTTCVGANISFSHSYNIDLVIVLAAMAVDVILFTLSSRLLTEVAMDLDVFSRL